MTTHGKSGQETRWQITVTVETALCIGDSGVSGTLADKTTVKTSDGKLYIPASTFKGIWRHACEAIARGQGERVCESPRAENMCSETHCIICELFGSPTKPSRIVINDLKTDFIAVEPSIRNGVTINRNRRTAEDARLYFIETSSPNAGIPFVGEVTISGAISKKEDDLLRAGLKFVHAMGTGKSRGLGWLSINVEPAPEKSIERPAIERSDPERTELEIEVKLRSPLMAGGRKPMGQAVESIPYIRGGLLRGAVAQVWMADSEGDIEEDHDFRKMFLEADAAIFRNCYPALTSTPKVLPATAVGCKDSPGFLGEGSKESHGVFDTLLERIAAESVDWLYHPTCPFCQGRVEASTGFYTQTGACYRRESSSTRLLTRVAINRYRKVAEDELLYHLSALDAIKAQEPVRLVGSASIPSELVGVVSALIQNRIHHLGGGASRGLGQVSLKVSKREADAPLDPRVRSFNEHLRELWEAYHHLPTVTSEPLEATYFSIDLQSDVILAAEDGWQRSMILTARTLQQAAGCGAEVECVRSFATYDYVGGWNAAHGLPKERELVTRMGSVFVFRTREMDSWYEPLKRLEMIGIGNRRVEGFGQVIVCEPFHLRTRGKLQENLEKGEA